MTGNKLPNLIIQARPYDFKDSKYHIYFIDSLNIEKGCLMLLNRLASALNDSSTTRMMSDDSLKYTIKTCEIIKEYNGHNPKDDLYHLYKTITLFQADKPLIKVSRLEILDFHSLANSSLLLTCLPNESAILSTLAVILFMTISVILTSILTTRGVC